MDYARQFVTKGFETGIIRVNFEAPFPWVSGFFMPIYNDCKAFSFYPEYMDLISFLFEKTISEKNLDCDVVAGVSTGGIPFGKDLSTKLGKPFVWVKKEPKKYGLGKQVEGIVDASELTNKKVILVEDAIARATSSVPAVRALREVHAICNHCISVFDYRFREGNEKFREINCDKHSIYDLDDIFRVGAEENYINGSTLSKLSDWREDPFGWGEKHGFLPVKRE